MQAGICFIQWISFWSFDCACIPRQCEWNRKDSSSKSSQMLGQIESDTHTKHFMKSVTIHSMPCHSIPFIHGLNVRFKIHWNAPNDTQPAHIFYRHLNLFGISISLSNEVQPERVLLLRGAKNNWILFHVKRSHDFSFKWYINFGLLARHVKVNYRWRRWRLFVSERPLYVSELKMIRQLRKMIMWIDGIDYSVTMSNIETLGTFSSNDREKNGFFFNLVLFSSLIYWTCMSFIVFTSHATLRHTFHNKFKLMW